MFSVSFTTALPRRGRQRRLPSPPPLQHFSIPQRSARHSAPSAVLNSAETRRTFTNARVHQQQQAAAAEPASKVNSSNPRTAAQASGSISPNTGDLTKGLNDNNLEVDPRDSNVDWTRSFDGLSKEAFSPEAAKILTAPVNPDDIEIKSDGIIYLPEIKYRRILNQAFGPGGWGLAPRGETIVTSKAVTREYALVALGRYVARHVNF